MNQYQFDIIEWKATVSHLTLLERAICLELTNWYCQNEAPLPADMPTLAKRISATTPDEIAALTFVLSDCFVREELGYASKNTRLTTAVAEVRQAAIDEQAKREARAERNRANGQRGGRPKKGPQKTTAKSKPTVTTVPETQNDQVGFSSTVIAENPEITQNNPVGFSGLLVGFSPEESGTCKTDEKGCAIDVDFKTLERSKPIAQLVDPKPPQALGSVFLQTQGVSKQVAIDWMLVRSKKRMPLTKTAWDAIAREVAKAKITTDEALRLCVEKCWAGFKAEWWNNEMAARPAAAKQQSANLQWGFK